MDLLQRFAALGRAFKNVGVSAREASDAFESLGRAMPTERGSLPNTCPRCMQQVSWRQAEPELVSCASCGWRFDEWALRNNDFAELRAQVLEFQLRDMELRRQRENEDFEDRILRDIVRPQAGPQRPKTPDEMTVHERLVRAQELVRRAGDLTEDELRELTQIASIASGEHPRSVAREGSFRRNHMQVPVLRPLEGRGVSGDEALMGNEEALTFTTQEVQVRTGTTSNADGIVQEEMTAEDIRRAVSAMERAQQEMIEREVAGLYFYNDTNSEEPKAEPEKVKPQKPLKRKLDL